jgi:hypothetical protein
LCTIPKPHEVALSFNCSQCLESSGELSCPEARFPSRWGHQSCGARNGSVNTAGLENTRRFATGSTSVTTCSSQPRLRLPPVLAWNAKPTRLQHCSQTTASMGLGGSFTQTAVAGCSITRRSTKRRSWESQRTFPTCSPGTCSHTGRNILPMTSTLPLQGSMLKVLHQGTNSSRRPEQELSLGSYCCQLSILEYV